jgi:hypothetical protein
VVECECAGDHVSRLVGQRQILGDRDGEGHGWQRAPPGVRDRGLGRVHSGDVSGGPGRRGQLPGQVAAAAPDVQHRIAWLYPGQGDQLTVHGAAAAAECDLADQFIQPEPVDRGAGPAPSSVQAPERVMHDSLLRPVGVR